MRIALLLLLLIPPAAARAAEDDAGYAPPERWAHPRGPASGTGRSHARAPESFGGIRWKLSAGKTFLAAPVTWDGIAFLVDGSKSKADVLAVDAVSGDVLARAAIKEPGRPAPAAFDDAVFLLEEGSRLVQLRLQGRTLARRWTYEAGKGAFPPRVFAGEIYLTSDAGLLRLRAGSRKPVWEAPGIRFGEAAVYGDHVYVLGRTAAGALELSVHRRGDGGRVHGCVLAEKASADRGGEVIVTNGLAIALLPPEEERTWALLTRKVENGVPALALVRTEKLLTPPLAGPEMALAVTGNAAWSVLRPGKPPVHSFAKKEDRPDLVIGAPSAISMQGLFCFGTWAADLNSNLILWHLGERPGLRLFDKGLRYNAVPYGDESLLLVTRDGKTLCAMGPEEIGR